MAVDDRCLRVARFACHEVAVLGIDAHRQRGSRVGHKVDPEDLGRQKRDGKPGLRRAGQSDQASQDDAEEDGDHLAHVRRKEEAKELADVVEDAATLLHGVDDRRVVVVGEDHLSGFLRDLGARDAHGDTDVGRLQRGGVVHAVTGHGNDQPVILQRVDDPQLVLWCDARVDVDLPHGGAELVLAHAVDVCAGERSGIAILDDAQIKPDTRGGLGVVAGDHHRADAGAVCLLDRGSRLFAGRVDDCHDADEDQLVLVFLGGLVEAFGQCSVRDSQGAVTLRRDLFDRLEDASTSGFTEILDAAAHLALGAVFKEHVGGALRE